ncbi:MAG: hypothetical protein HC880_17000 [Bacteroidia bacterium]|nr:hypothetical protein [Bacteroidia bacterium]
MKRKIFIGFTSIFTHLLFMSIAQGQNHIVVHGHQDPQQIEAMVNHYAKHWEIDGMTIIVSFTPEMNNALHGWVQYEENQALQQKNAFIKINKNIETDKQFIALAHEMIHVKQYYRGELVAHTDKAFSWKGQSFTNILRLAYTDRAWEEEAFGLERALYFNFLQHQQENNLATR